MHISGPMPSFVFNPFQMTQRFSSLLHCLLLQVPKARKPPFYIFFKSHPILSLRVVSGVFCPVWTTFKMGGQMELYCNSKKRSQREMVDEKISAWITKGYIYWHLAGCYIRYTVVIWTIYSNGGKVLILYLLEIEMPTILALFNM